MVKNIEERPAFQYAGVYVIHEKATGKYAGKILFAWPKSAGDGILYASMWDFTQKHSRDVQNGRATGGGYDKESAALDGMIFGKEGEEFVLRCDGTGMNAVSKIFDDHGYVIQWVV